MAEEINRDEREEKQDETEEKKTGTARRSWLFLLTFFALTAVCIVFAILCIYETDIPFMQAHRGWMIALAVAVLCAFCGISVWFTLAGKESLEKTAFSAYLLILFALVLLFALQKTGFFEVVSSAENLQAYLERAGVWMPLVYILLQYLQVVLLPIPSVVSTVAGVALFGPFKTMLFSLAGILPASVTAFLIGRKLGSKAVAWMIGEDTLRKWQEKLKGKDNLLLSMMFVLPMFPDDALCFIAGLSSMSTKYFLIIITISRLLVVSGTCYSFEFIPLNTWWGLLIWAVFVAAIVTVFVLAYKNLDKIQAWIQDFKNRKHKGE